MWLQWSPGRSTGPASVVWSQGQGWRVFRAGKQEHKAWASRSTGPTWFHYGGFPGLTCNSQVLHPSCAPPGEPRAMEPVAQPNSLPHAGSGEQWGAQFYGIGQLHASPATLAKPHAQHHYLHCTGLPPVSWGSGREPRNCMRTPCNGAGCLAMYSPGAHRYCVLQGSFSSHTL